MARLKFLLVACIRLLALATVIVGGTRAEAQVKSFKINGAGIVDYIPTAPGLTPAHWAVGNATELGKYYGLGAVQVDDVVTGAFSSAVPFVCEAANGDKLAFDYSGFVQVLFDENGAPYTLWIAEFTPALAQCTGRFSKVIDGSFIMTAISAPFNPFVPAPVEYSWEGKGWIEYKRKGS
ncbi:MAG: hypothetical protein U0840_08705 [Gemmataceae bacterium]